MSYEQNEAITRDGRPKLPKRTLVSVFVILIAIPLTLYFGAKIGEKQYYFVSLFIILYTLIPFFLLFERRKPQARELVVIAVLCALAVAGRAAFAFLPFFKPLVAIVIITGIAFGAESGFLCGAVSGFVSNFIFGQGPWTPWQMFAYGIAGFLAGILYSKRLLSKKRLPLCFFGALVVMLVVGPLLDTSTLFTMPAVITPVSALAIYASGVPVNVVHAAATAVFLFLLARPLLEKLDRIKMKYGMLEGGR